MLGPPSARNPVGDLHVHRVCLIRSNFLAIVLDQRLVRAVLETEAVRNVRRFRGGVSETCITFPSVWGTYGIQGFIFPEFQDLRPPEVSYPRALNSADSWGRRSNSKRN